MMEEEEESMELTSQGAGTYWYLPPECFTTGRTPKISSKVDIWSCGVILYQMLYGKRPFGDDMPQEKIVSEKTVSETSVVEFPTKPREIPLDAKNFISKCLVANQDLRPDIFTLSKDMYLIWNSPVNIDKLPSPFQESITRQPRTFERNEFKPPSDSPDNKNISISSNNSGPTESESRSK